MASTIVHFTIALRIKNKLRINNLNDYLLGSIAPDIGKLTNVPKEITHFTNNNPDYIPDVDLFIKEYPNYKENDFLLGYFVHLFADKIWFGELLKEVVYDNKTHFLDGTITEFDHDKFYDYLYLDYDNLNKRVIKKYNINYDFLKKPFIKPNTNIREIDVNKLPLLIEKTIYFIEHDKSKQLYLVSEDMINEYIDHTIQKTINYLERNHYYEV